MHKGISAVIAVILLLLITIAIVGFAFSFFQRTTQTATQTGEQQLGQQISQIGTHFVIDGVEKNQVYVRNIGTSPLSNLGFYVNNVAVNYAGPASLTQSAVGTYTLDATAVPTLDGSQVRVTSAGGVIDRMTLNFDNELLQNPGFENDLSGWIITGDATTYAVDASTPHSGVKSGRITNGLSFCNDYFYQDIPVNPNTNYAFSGWIKKTATTSGEGGPNFPGILVTQRDSTGNPWTNLMPVARSELTGGQHDWTQLVVNFNSGSNTILRFSFFMWWCYTGPGSNTGSIWYDDAKLFKLY